MGELSQHIRKTFIEKFQKEPLLIHSPGRVNLIGEHTDYNEGFVLPAAIDKAIVLAMAPNDCDKIRLHAVDMEAKDFQISLEATYSQTQLHWVNYILGAIDELGRAGYPISGFDCVFGSDLPIGAGLSSSAALEGGVIYGLSTLFEMDLSRQQMAFIGQKAENNFVGMQCGIMDQFANIFGKDDHVIKLDCRTLEYEYFPFQMEDIVIMLCDTGVRRELAGSEYNVRREQCNSGVQCLQEFCPEIKSLRDVSLSHLEKHRESINPLVYKRCRFVVEENQRVVDACMDLKHADITSFGERMYQSHYGLRDQYEVSCPELDVLVEATENINGVIGSRMMGGGFGGCTINLIYKDQQKQIIKTLHETYESKTGRELITYIASIGKGTHAFDHASNR